MIKPLGKNVLLKVKNTQNTIIMMPNEHHDLYEVIEQGELVELNLIGKVVFVKEGLQKLEYENHQYYVVDIKDILAIIEE